MLVRARHRPAFNLWAVAIGVCLTALVSPAQTIDPSFSASPLLAVSVIGAAVWAVVPQMGGSLLVEGQGFDPRQIYNGFGRLYSNGVLDASFQAPYMPLGALVSQPDGKLLAGGQPNFDLGRLNPDGTPDTNFDCQMDGLVYSLMLQPDGKILVGGKFTTLGGEACTNFGRITSHGNLDTSFRSGSVGMVWSFAVQPDGKILAAGDFTSLGGQPCTNLARLNSDGTLDTGFSPRVSGDLGGASLSLQGDGKILLRGFGWLTNAVGEGTPLIRLNSDGSLDTTFESAINDMVTLAELQADGEIVVVTEFPSAISRLNSGGSPDSSFSTVATGSTAPDIQCMALQDDGKILVGGDFGALAGDSLQRIGRLDNTETATNDLAFDGSTVTWMRGGSAPEVDWVRFEGSTNGTDWMALGNAVRIAGGWRLQGVQLPTNSAIRAFGLVNPETDVHRAAYFVHSSVGPPFIFTQPASQTVTADTAAALSAGVGGSRPLRCQWLFNGASTSGGTNVLLSLGNAQAADEGTYNLTVTNLYGGVNSGAAVLTVTNPPPPGPAVISGTKLKGTGIEFSWNTIWGFKYQVQSATALSQATWQQISGSDLLPWLSGYFAYQNLQGVESFTALGSSLTLSVPFATNQERFYRVVRLP